MKDFNITAAPGVAEIIVRTGTAPQIIEPQKFTFSGAIGAPLAFYKSRIAANAEYFDKSKAVVRVDADKRTIILLADPTAPHSDVIEGVLFAESLLAPFRINDSGTPWKPQELATFLRKNRMYFADTQKGNELIAELMNLKITTKGEIEQSDDKRSNKKSLFVQTIETGLPLNFSLEMPIFSGGEKVKFNIDVYLDVQGQTAYISLESSDLIEQTRNGVFKIINDEIDGFKESGFPILYQ